jgi:endoglucanase
LAKYSDSSETENREKVEWISRSSSLLKIDSTGRIISQGTAGYVWIVASIRNGQLVDSTLVTINTVEIISPIQDAYVRDGNYAATNFGTEQVISAKTGGSGYNRRAYLKFDLSSLKGKNVEGAVISMTLTATDITATMPVTFYEVTDNNWTETAINWNNKPAQSTSLDTVIVGNSVGTTYYWNIDAWIKANKGLNEASLCFLDPSNTDKHAVFGSRENSANAPKLFVSISSGATAVQKNLKVQRTELTIIPNPFNPVTKILLPSITTKDKASISLCIFSSDGKLIADLSNAAQRNDSVLWNCQHQPSGTYLLQVRIGNSTLNRRITLLK